MLSGSLKEIKKNYRKKVIRINGNVNLDELKKCKGVLEVNDESLDIIVKIESDEYIDDVFKIVKKGNDITKFIVEDASLNEIFVSLVGEAYEK